MADELDQNLLLPDTSQMPDLILPRPFSLAQANEVELGKILAEVADKEEQWETEMNGFFGEWSEYADSWRMIPRQTGSKKPSGLFNSKSGETNRAANTLATIWFRMLTSGDPFFEAVVEGLAEDGNELTEEDLYSVEGVLGRQLRTFKFKSKLLRSLRSMGLFGTTVMEEFWNRLKGIEGTDTFHRSLLTTGFDPFVFDIEMSDYIFTIDFISIHKLRQMAKRGEGEIWNTDRIEKAFDDSKESSLNKGITGKSGNIFQRIIERKQRAGYHSIATKDLIEIITYHGKLNSNSSVLQELWQSLGRTDDISDTDWTVAIMNGTDIIRLHPEPYGDWRHSFKIASYNEFELEPIGYGVGKIGRKIQRELDVTQSRANDILMFSLFSMWKLGRFAGLKPSQLTIKPWGIVELEDINQLEQLRPQIEAIAQALAMQGMLKEDFRTTTGATSNLQAIITKATATEASLTQSEAIRGASVAAELIAETFLREHIETMHINNLDLLDEDIRIAISGNQKQKIRSMNRINMPRNVGFQVKVVTDKDYRPDRLTNLLQWIQLGTSIRNMMPMELDLKPAFEEASRMMGINPRKMWRNVSVADKLIDTLRRQQRLGQGGGGIGQEIQGEIADEEAGGMQTQSTPMGEIPTSPLASELVQPGL